MEPYGIWCNSRSEVRAIVYITTRGGAKQVHFLQIIVQVLTKQHHITAYAILFRRIQMSEGIG